MDVINVTINYCKYHSGKILEQVISAPLKVWQRGCHPRNYYDQLLGACRTRNNKRERNTKKIKSGKKEGERKKGRKEQMKMLLLGDAKSTPC